MIEFKDVSKVYPNGTRGLSHVNLQIEQGEFVAVIGLSGAGKSTLIRTINRMIDLTEGQVIVDDVDVMTLKGRSLRRFRRKIGMIFQSFNLVTRSTALKTWLTSMVPDMNSSACCSACLQSSRSSRRSRRWTRWAYSTRPTPAATSSPAASSSAWRSPARSIRTPPSYWPTSPSPRSTR